MAADVSRNAQLFPAAVDWGFRGQSGVDVEVVQEAVRLQKEKICAVAILGIIKRAGQQTHVGQVE